MALTNNPVVLGGGSAEANTSAIITTAGGVVIQQPGASTGLQIYNTADQTTNYERLEALWSGNVAQFRTVHGGSGTARVLQIAGDGGLTFSTSATDVGIILNPTISVSTTPAQKFTNINPFAGSATAQNGASFLYSVTQTSTAAFTDLLVNRTQNSVGSGAQLLLDLQVATVSKFKVDNAGSFTAVGNANFTGQFLTYKGVASAGWGVPAIQNSGRITAQSSNATIGTYTPGAADGSFRVSANMNVTASTTLVTTITCAYTDESNTARVLVMPVAPLSGTWATAGAITGAGASVWHSAAMHIRCKASTAITVATTAGTFTGVTYTAECSIQQIA